MASTQAEGRSHGGGSGLGLHSGRNGETRPAAAWLGLRMELRSWKLKRSGQQRSMDWEGRQMGNTMNAAEVVKWVAGEELEDRLPEMLMSGADEDGSSQLAFLVCVEDM